MFFNLQKGGQNIKSAYIEALDYWSKSGGKYNHIND